MNQRTEDKSVPRGEFMRDLGGKPFETWTISELQRLYFIALGVERVPTPAATGATPETDAMANDGRVPVYLARQLERQRDDARRELVNYQRHIAYSEKCEHELRQRAERAEARVRELEAQSPSAAQQELEAIHFLSMNPQETAPKEGDPYTLALLKQLLSVARSSSAAAPVYGECEECGQTVLTPLKRFPSAPTDDGEKR